MRIGLGLLVICGLLAFWVVRDRRHAEAVPAPPVAKPTPDPLLHTDLLALPELVRSRYRLAPDRRFQIALAGLEELTTGNPPRPVTTRFRDGGWDVTLGGEQVGRLPEIPTFADDTGLLVAWAKAHSAAAASAPAAPPPAVDGFSAGIEALDPDAILAELLRLDRRFAHNRSDPAVIAAASHGYAWLSFLAVDSLERLDAVLGRAWALLALEKSLALPSAAEHETVLASALGYEAAAAAAAQALPAGLPLRLYAERDRWKLSVECGRQPRNLLCRDFELALIADPDGEVGLRRALDDWPIGAKLPLPWLAIVSRVGWCREKGAELAERALVSLARARGADAPKLARVESASQQFENDLQAYAGRAAGALVDRATVQSYYQAWYYGGLLTEGLLAVDQLGSGPMGREVADKIADPAPGLATQLRRWIRLRAERLDTKATVADLQAGVRELDLLGAPAAEDVAASIARLTSPIDFPRREPMPALFARLDSRPQHLATATTLTYTMLASAALYEKYLRAAAAAAPHQFGAYAASVALLDEDRAKLRAIADDATTAWGDKEYALGALEELGGDEAFLRSRYAAISPGDSGSASPLFRYLERRGDHAGALREIRGTIAGYRGGEDLGWAHLVTEEAAVLRKLGRLDEAFSTIGPAAETWKEEAIEEAATIELERGQLAAGIQLARRSLGRYPKSPEPSALIARGQWLAGDYEQAASELATSKNGVTDRWNALLPAAFVAAFEKAPEADAVRALDLLARHNVEAAAVAQVAGEWGRKGHVDAALRVLSGLRTTELSSKLHTVLVGYDLLRETKGEDAALAWVTQTVAAPTHQEAIILLQFRRCALLLGRYPPPQTDEHRPMRVMLAAALLQLGETQGGRWDSLTEAVDQDADARDWYRNAALVLLGKADSSSFRPLMHGVDATVEDIGWLMGMRAAHEGHAEEADAWFQVSLEANRANNPPPAWAYSIETDWLGARRSLASMERQGTLLRPPIKPPRDRYGRTVALGT